MRGGLLEVEAAQGMLAWPHSGFHVHDGVWVPAEDRAFATQLARVGVATCWLGTPAAVDPHSGSLDGALTRLYLLYFGRAD